MGGSLGLALKKNAKNKYYIIGVARREETLKAALKIGAADKVSLSLQDVKECDIVVICTPVDTVVPFYKQLSEIAGKNTIITDTGSVKEQIERQITNYKLQITNGACPQMSKSGESTATPHPALSRKGRGKDVSYFAVPSPLAGEGQAKPEGEGSAVNFTLHTPNSKLTSSAVNSTLPFVAVHPMAGRESNGIASADAQMFENANIVITGSIKKSLKNEAKVAAMWKDAGAHIINMPSKKHDELVALTSHLPHLIAFSLNKIYKDKKKKNRIIEKIAAGSFKSATRVANSSADMWAPIFAANSGNIIEHLDAFIKELNAFKKVLKNKDKMKKEILKTQK